MKKKILIIFIVLFIIISIFFVNNDNSTIRIVDYEGNNLMISIDGNASNTLPTSGSYYLVDYSCKSSKTKITWDRSSHELSVSNGNKGSGVACYLEFKSKPYLSEMESGSYVAYTGNNGCNNSNVVNGYTSCSGKNENYVSDNMMGYCDYNGYQFYVNGWRIGYVEKGSAYLVSAGAPECVKTFVDNRSSGRFYSTMPYDYYYGSGYVFDEITGKFSLTGVSSTTLNWSIDYQSIIDNTPYTCRNNLAEYACDTMKEIVDFRSSTEAIYYNHYNYDNTEGTTIHKEKLNLTSLKYCNNKFSNGGVCDINTARAMNEIDFSKITKKDSLSNCGDRLKECGYNNDLIDNGGYYWFAANKANETNETAFWVPFNRLIGSDNSSELYGVRPVLHLDSSVIVTGGSGTYEDPYQISNNTFFINDGVSILNDSDNLSAVSLNLISSEDVSSMCISVDTSVCTNYVTYGDTYSFDMSSYNDGEHIIYVYYKDSNGDIIASINRSIIIDTVAPTDNSISISEGTTVDRTLTLASTGASYMCFSNTSNNASDCTDWVDYATTYGWSLTSGDGEKTVCAFYKDEAGNISNPVSATTTVSGSTS